MFIYDNISGTSGRVFDERGHRKSLNRFLKMFHIKSILTYFIIVPYLYAPQMDFSYEFAYLTLSAGTSNADNCGANGLPMTSASIKMHGNFMALIEAVKHENLVQYLSANRKKHEKVIIVYEHYNHKLPPNSLERIAMHALNGLYHLHYEIGCIHGAITPAYIVYDARADTVKLSEWALNVITEFGSLLDSDAILPDDCRFLPLEQLMGLKPSRNSDVWSLALTILALMGVEIPENPYPLVTCKTAEEVLHVLNFDGTKVSRQWNDFFRSALEPRSSRATVKQLMGILEIPIPSVETDPLERMMRFNRLKNSFELSVSQMYHLWCLAFPQHLNSDSRKPPILTLPNLVQGNVQSLGTNERNVQRKLSFIPKAVKTFPIEKLKERLATLDPSVFFPLILSQNNTQQQCEPMTLPLIIRESDFNYQCERIMLFSRLIDGFPYDRPSLLRAAKVDIPPFYRGSVWAALLNIKWSDLLMYERIDKVTPTPTDRQISVDIPRCHQYNDLLASPMGHAKLTRILKAWLTHNESNGSVYWQGLDSLASPFVILNFNNEPQAFACFNAFINKYLRGFFVRDNSLVIQEYLSLFSQLMAFHDPNLFNHLEGLTLLPDLYAIPWFLTMFTHVLPLHKTMHVWDALLLGDESFALYLGLAILEQLRDHLLEYSFNDCILIFSDLPEIDIDRCVRDAIRLFCLTPKSVTRRGVKSIQQLRNETVSRVDVSDVIKLMKKEKTKIVFIDTRTDDEVKRFGAIRGSVEQFDASASSGHLVVVINDHQMAAQLVTENVAKVCVLVINGYIPNDLLV